MINQFDRGIDVASGTFTYTDAARQGAKFVLRYSAGAATDINHPSHAINAWKLCKQTEIQDILNAGMDFFANSEWYESRVTEGHDAGVQDATADLAFWKSRGLAQGAAVYYSWDEGQPDPSKHAGLADYFRGVASVFQGYYKIGLYAGDVAIEAMLAAGVIDFGWIAMSTSWSKPLVFQYQPGSAWLQEAQQLASQTKANILQNGNRWYNGQADEDVILHVPAGSHLEALGSVPPAPVQQPTLHRPWPSYMKPGNYFGDYRGPAVSHGGYYTNERPDVAAIQNRLNALGFNCGSADGIFGPMTIAAASAWQKAHYAATTEYYGQIWSDDWAHLFTY